MCRSPCTDDLPHRRGAKQYALAVRCAYYVLTGKNIDPDDFS